MSKKHRARTGGKPGSTLTTQKAIKLATRFHLGSTWEDPDVKVAPNRRSRRKALAILNAQKPTFLWKDIP